MIDRRRVRRRLAVYHKQTNPLIAFYDQRGLLVTVDGTRAPADVAEEIATALADGRDDEGIDEKGSVTLEELLEIESIKQTRTLGARHLDAGDLKALAGLLHR